VTTFIGVLSERFARQRLQAMAKIESSEPGTPSVLFLCVHNAGEVRWPLDGSVPCGRSSERVHRRLRAGAELNPEVVEVMAESASISTRNFRSPGPTRSFGRGYRDRYGLRRRLPHLPGKRYVDWDLADPAGQDLSTVRAIRDEIRTASKHS